MLILDPNIINQHYLKTQIEEAGILTDVSSSIEEVEMFMFSNKAELLIMASETLSTTELQAIRKWRREGRTIRIMILNSSNDIEHK
ncbi:TPA: DNA-binding response regulator, partial [Enterobacter cloacae]|nr:DNA-binding response regulator [Enterobacter cloacae]